MSDSPRCVKCGNDQIADVMQDGMPLCAKCAGIPSLAERLNIPVMTRPERFGMPAQFEKAKSDN